MVPAVCKPGVTAVPAVVVAYSEAPTRHQALERNHDEPRARANGKPRHFETRSKRISRRFAVLPLNVYAIAADRERRAHRKTKYEYLRHQGGVSTVRQCRGSGEQRRKAARTPPIDTSSRLNRPVRCPQAQSDPHRGTVERTVEVGLFHGSLAPHG
jgi:hypothetical protein